MSQPSQMVKITRTFAASAERVFAAWLDPKTAGRWLFSTSAGRVVRTEIDAKVGGRYVIVDRREVGDVEHTGEYLEIDRPKRLVFTLVVPMYSSAFTRVSIEIVPLSTSSCELDRPRRLVFTFGMPQFSAGFAKVTVEMTPEGEGTLMTLTHEKLPWSAVSETEKGWGAMLDRLPAFL